MDIPLLWKWNLSLSNLFFPPPRPGCIYFLVGWSLENVACLF
jgi:hypothetical protein